MGSALHALVLRIEEYVSNGEFAFGIFLDICGAFDSVSYDAILGALCGAGMVGIILKQPNAVVFLMLALPRGVFSHHYCGTSSWGRSCNPWIYNQSMLIPIRMT